ncbi:MAG: PAS domain S-box protein [Chloroflexaceae bacterium]|nr:PAS domain S-box protein [Chloroflexaceae bacterium]
MADPTNKALQAEITTLHQRIAELDQQVAAIQQLEERYRMVADYTYDWEYWRSTQGHFLYTSPSCERITGYAPEAFLADASLMVRITHPEDREKVCQHIEDMRLRRGIGYMVFRIIARNGEEHWIEHVCQPTFDAAGMVTGSRASNRDITRQKQAEERLKLFETLVERAIDSVTITDRAGTWQYVNVATVQAHGAEDASELLGKDLVAFLAPEERHRFATEILPHLQAHGIWQGRIWCCRPDEHRWLALSSCFTITDDAGAVTAMASITRDVTVEHMVEQRWQQMHAELEQQAAELRTFYALAENAPDGIAVTRMDNMIIYANSTFRTMMGYGDAVVGMHVYDLYQEHADSLRPITQTAIEQGSWRGVLTYRRKDGSTFQTQLSIFAIRDPEGQIIALGRIVRDLTDQMRHDREMLALKEEVIATQRKAIHDLSAPLIPLSDRVVVMPLVGAVDSLRAQQIMETLLQGLEQQRASTAILDVTGVQVVDTTVANLLLQAAQAAMLLGTSVILTGVRPEIAQVLVHLGADLSHIVTCATLQAGIAHALRRRSLR